MTTITFTKTDLSSIANRFDVGVANAHIFLTYGDITKLKKDFGTGLESSVVAGSPTLSSSNALFTGFTDYVSTDTSDSDALTIFTIAKRPTTDYSLNALAVSNNASGDIGVSIIWNSSGNIAFAAARDNGSGGSTSAQATLLGVGTNQWAFVCGETSSSTKNTITDLKLGTVAEASNLNSRRIGANKLRLGGAYINTYNGSINHFMTVVFNRLLTSTEKNTVIAAMRKLALHVGITV